MSDPQGDAATDPYYRVAATTSTKEGATARGEGVHIATVTFRIVSEGAQLEGVRALVARFLVNTFSYPFVSSLPAHVYDSRGQNSEGTAWLHVSPAPEPVGLYASSTR